VRLFRRTTRKLLPDGGLALLILARSILEASWESKPLSDDRERYPSGWYALEVNVTADHFLAQRLPTLLVDHTGLKIELMATASVTWSKIGSPCLALWRGR
jgi:DNA-binding transcriptional LysR family regulator